MPSEERVSVTEDDEGALWVSSSRGKTLLQPAGTYSDVRAAIVAALVTLAVRADEASESEVASVTSELREQAIGLGILEAVRGDARRTLHTLASKRRIERSKCDRIGASF